jgi:hypothetical protein
MVLLAIVGFGAADVPFPLFFGLLGFLSGVTFSGLLGLLAGNRRFNDMSIPRFAGWGAAGGVLLAGACRLLVGPDVELTVLGPIFAVAGAISAAGTLALARRAEKADALSGPA